METPTPSQVPLPTHLPSPWEQPEDEQQFWTSDPMHFPYPITMIDDVLIRTIYGPGINHGFSTYHVPLRANSRRFWAHHFHAMSPLMLPEEEMEAMGKQSQEKLRATMGRLMEHWETGWLPQIKQLLGEWERFDLQAASMPELLVHLDATVERLERAWSLHFEIVLPSQLPISLFDEFYRDLFEDANPFAAYELLQGFDNMTLRAGSELWMLSRKARESPDVCTIFEERAASDVISALGESDDGRAFLDDLRLYLQEYGQRGSIWGVSPTSWIEDPTPVVNNLKDYITRSDGDPNLDLESLAAEREQLIAEARDRLRLYPEAVRDTFESLLAAAQAGNLIAEEHGYWIDSRATYQFRRVFMEFGRRFAEAGVIERADDIFHLTVHEICESADQLPHGDRKELVETRKAEIARFVDIRLPAAIGTPPPGPPPVNPMTQTLGKFFGTPPQPSTDPDVLNGAAGSPGVVRGPARIVRSMNEAGRLKPGDILVTETTAPPWTPLFATVAAVVTDYGGILSHCAVVAREYRLPAVVGVRIATSAIADGQQIEVDGNQGVVRILRDG